MHLVDLNSISFVNRDFCPVCGHTENSDFIRFPDIPVVRCGSCHFMYSQRLMDSGALSDYYRNGFGSDRHRQGQYINARINTWAISRLLPVDAIKSFLDIGAGYGFLLENVRNRYAIEGIGVELSEQESNYGRDRLSVDIRNTVLNETNIPKNEFDLVACFEVVEHIPDPISFVQELIEYVKPGGYLLVMTDNFESSVARHLGPGFPKWIPHSHISHFAPMTLERLFADPRIELIKRMSYTPWELLAKSLSSRLHGVRQQPEDAFHLESVLDSEMQGRFRLFWLRQYLNPLWARLTARSHLDGALMYLVGQRRG